MRGAPQWLRGLLSEEFFDACAAHPGERKNDKNHFCIDCAAALCRHCLPHEHAHDVLQVPHTRVAGTPFFFPTSSRLIRQPIDMHAGVMAGHTPPASSNKPISKLFVFVYLTVV